jgi:hypothetical protein
MKNHAFVGGACGALVGSALCLHWFGLGWGIVLAMIVGGIVGWIVQDPTGFKNTLIETSMDSFSGTVVWVKSRITFARTIPVWKCYKGKWKSSFLDGYSGFLLVMGISTFIMNTMILLGFLGEKQGIGKMDVLVASLIFSGMCLASFVLLATVCILYTSLIISSAVFWRNQEEVYWLCESEKKPISMDSWKMLTLWNPIMFPFSLTWYTLKGCLWLAKRVPFLAGKIAFVLAFTCYQAHNEKRLAALVGASLGTLIGAWAGSIIVGALFGGAVSQLMALIGAHLPKRFIADLKGSAS